MATDVNNDKYPCLLYTSDAADERSSVDLGGRRIIKKTKQTVHSTQLTVNNKLHTLTRRTHQTHT